MARIGPKESTIDDKGRITIPKLFRECYQGSVVVTGSIGTPGPCVWIMLPSDHEAFKKNYRNGRLSQTQRLDFEKRYVEMAEDVEIDAMGRIPIHPVLRRYAKLNKECIVANSIKRLEISDTETYFANFDKTEGISYDGFNMHGDADLFGTEEGN